MKHIGALVFSLFSVMLFAQERSLSNQELPGDTLSIEITGAEESLGLEISDSVLNFASHFIGVPYRTAGKSPQGFDCSGFTHYVYKHFGLTLPPSSVTQFQKFERIEKCEARKGDLIFFKGRKSTGPGHVGIVSERKNNDELVFIHASVNKGVCYDTTDSPYYRSRYLMVKRPVVAPHSFPECK